MLTDQERAEMDKIRAERAYKPAVYSASHFNPEKQAEIIKLSESRKIPIETVERNLPELRRREKFDAFDLDANKNPKTAEYFSDDRNSRISIDDVDNLKGLESTIDNMEHGVLSNAGRGALDRVNTLTGNLLELYGNYEEGFSKKLKEMGIPNPGINFGDDGVSWTWDIDSTKKSAIGEIGKAVSSEGSAYGYVPRFTWEEFKGDMNASNLAGFVLEQGVKSIPDMLAVIATLPAYIGSRTEEIAESRVKNDERKDVEGSDLLTALPVAVGTALLEKIGAKFVFGAGKAKGIKDIAGATGSGMLVEGGTEFFQEGAEYLGETLGTKKKVSGAEMFDRQLAGFVAGSGMGGAIKGTTSTFEAATGNLVNKNISEAAQSYSEQESIDNIVSFAQSSKTNEMDSGRFKKFVDNLNTKKQVYISNEAVHEALESGVELPSYITDQLEGPATDITVSVKDFASDLAGNEEFMGAVREHIKLNPNTFTQSELKDSSDISVQEIIKKSAKQQQILTESEEVYNDVKDQLVGVGGKEVTAKHHASLFSKMVVSEAAEQGISPKEYYDRIGLKVVDDETIIETPQTESGATFEQDFGKLEIEEKRTLESGETGIITQDAQTAWGRNVKRRQQVDKLRGCINA